MTARTPRALLVLACAALCALALVACGESDDESGATAASLVAQTFDATAKADSGRLTANFGLEPEGLLALGGPIKLRAAGPFAAPAAGELPRFDLAIAATLAGRPITAGAISTGDEAYLELDGRAYKLDAELVAKLQGVFGGGGGGGGGIAALGLDPQRWITNPTTQPDADVGGVATTRVTGAIDVPRLLADVAELLDGAAGSSAGGGLLTPKLRKQLAAAVTSSKVEVSSGAQDKILRQLAVVIDFAFEKGTQPPITGLDGGRIKLNLRLDDVNATDVKVTAPKDARPLSELAQDGGLEALLRGLGGAFGGGAGGGDGGEAFLRCLDEAGGKSADVAACTAKLAP